MNNISIILIVKNESKNIIKWTEWLPKLTSVNEIIVVDDFSEDDTLQKSKLLSSKTQTVKVFSRGLVKDFSDQRKFAVSKAKNNWILWLDADETPSDELINYINKIDFHSYNNYAFLRSDIFINKQLKHGETSSQYFLRLFNKKHGHFSGKVHELWVSSQPTNFVKTYIFHTSHDTLQSFFNKINFYSDIRSQELFERKTKTNLFQIIFYPFGKFIQNYIFRLGFLDGTPGIIVALGMSFHSFLVRSKLWCLYNP